MSDDLDEQEREAIRTAAKIRIGKCSHTCSDCGNGEKGHHFGDSYLSDPEEEPDHPLAKVGDECWYVCKHCPAWLSFEEFELLFEDEEGGDGF